jgi:hypothetical protein
VSTHGWTPKTHPHADDLRAPRRDRDHMLAAAQNANLALRFGLEMALLAVVAVAAWRSGHTPATRWTRVVLLPGAVAVAWVLLVHGASVPPPVRAAAQVAALALGVVVLRRLGARPLTTSSLAALAVGNAVLLAVWNQ